MMMRWIAVLSLLVSFTALGLTEDKKEDKKDEVPLKGRWVKEADGIEILFEFKTKTELILKASAGGNGIIITCKYTLDEKESRVSAEVTEVKEEGEFPAKPPKGYKFKCVFKLDKEKKTAKLSDYEAENADEVKPILEGEYKAKKAD